MQRTKHLLFLRPCRKVRSVLHPQIKLKWRQTKQNLKKNKNRIMFLYANGSEATESQPASRSPDWWGTWCVPTFCYLCVCVCACVGLDILETHSPVWKKKTHKIVFMFSFFVNHLLFTIIYNYHLRVSRWLRPKVLNTLHWQHDTTTVFVCFCF